MFQTPQAIILKPVAGSDKCIIELCKVIDLVVVGATFKDPESATCIPVFVDVVIYLEAEIKSTPPG
jgi:hypothetical protein